MLLVSFSFRVLALVFQFPEAFFIFSLDFALLPLFLPAVFPVFVGDSGIYGRSDAAVSHGSFLFRPVERVIWKPKTAAKDHNWIT